MWKANSELFGRKVKAEKNCRRLSRQLKDHESKSNERMRHACAKIRKANEREKLLAVSDATFGLQHELKKSVRGAECLKRNVLEVKVRDPNHNPILPICFVYMFYYSFV